MNRLAQTPYVTRRRARRTTLAAALSWEAQNLSPLAAVLRENQTMASVCRVTGPYAEGGKFRLVVFMPERKSLWLATREEADALKAQIERTIADLGSRTVSEALDEYLEHMRKQGVRPATMTSLSYRLGHFLPRDRSLSAITPEVAAKLYRDESDRFFSIQHHFPSQLIPYLRPCRSRVDDAESDGQRAGGDRQRSGERVGSRRFGTKAESPGLAVK